jgi:predicted TPR repeat methyltransferase
MNSPDPMLAKAMATHQAGRIAEAKAMYERILRRRPHDPDALNFLGMLEYQRGEQALGIRLLQKSLKSAPGNPHAWMNLGNMLLGTGDAESGVQAYERVTTLAPAMWQGWFNRATCLRRLRRLEEAVECLKTAISLKPDHDQAYEKLGMILYRAGKTRELAELYADWVKYNPDNPTARHMYAAAAGQAVPDRASDEYVRSTFDGFADTFDENLQELGYRSPQLLADALERHLGPVAATGDLEILDAGAGTGLCGPLLRARARRLVGVDLSTGMLEKARVRRVYDELVAAELGGYLRAEAEAFDVVLSADTLVYFGALEEVLAAAAGSLRPGGLLAFTVERWTDGGAAATFTMGPHGRYIHTEAYVAAALSGAGLLRREIAPAVLRSELGTDVQGMVVVAQRTGGRDAAAETV